MEQKYSVTSVEKLPQFFNEKYEVQNIKNSRIITKKIRSSINIEKNSLLKIITQVPIFKNALKVEKELVAVIPPELRKGLKDGTLKILNSKDGKLLSTIVNSKTNEIVHQMRLKDITKLVNPAELSKAMNQMCMQMQLDEIQKTLVDFRIESNTKLNEIAMKLHGERMKSTKSLKRNFERYLNNEDIKRTDLLLKIDEAITDNLDEISEEISALKARNMKSITKAQSDEINEKIGYVLESISNLQDIFRIELYLYKSDKNKCDEITKKYNNELLSTLTVDNIKFLDDYSDFDFLNLNENVWEQILIPTAKALTEQTNEYKKYLIEEPRK